MPDKELNNHNHNHNQEESLIPFPCLFPMKIIGIRHDDFINNIYQILKKYDNKLEYTSIKSQPSKNNNYISISVDLYIISKTQADEIYSKLSQHPMTKFVL